MNPSREGFIAFFGGPAWFAGLRGGRDQTGLPQIGVGLSIGGSRHHPCPLRLVDGGSTIDAASAVACCVGAPLSDRQKAVQNPPLLTPGAKRCQVELFVCNCVLAGDVLSTQAGLGAVSLGTTTPAVDVCAHGGISTATLRQRSHGANSELSSEYGACSQRVQPARPHTPAHRNE